MEAVLEDLPVPLAPQHPDPYDVVEVTTILRLQLGRVVWIIMRFLHDKKVLGIYYK